MDVPKDIGARYLCQAERILIADRPGAGDSIRAIARRLARPASTVSREVRRNSDPGAGGYGPYRAQQAAADRRKRPKARKARVGTRLWDEDQGRDQTALEPRADRPPAGRGLPR